MSLRDTERGTCAPHIRSNRAPHTRTAHVSRRAHGMLGDGCVQLVLERVALLTRLPVFPAAVRGVPGCSFRSPAMDASDAMRRRSSGETGMYRGAGLSKENRLAEARLRGGVLYPQTS